MQRRFLFAFAFLYLTPVHAADAPPPGSSPGAGLLVENESQRQALITLLDNATKYCGLQCAANAVFFFNKLSTLTFPDPAKPTPEVPK